jgi:hypothetical protein
MVSGEWPVSNFNKNGIETQASNIARKACGRCGTAIDRNALCPECAEFFRRLSKWKVVTANSQKAEPSVGGEWQVHCTEAKESQCVRDP